VTLLRRAFLEHRFVAIPLGILLLANAAVYALIVYPLEARSAGSAQRAAASVVALRQVERDRAGAAALVTGKARAEEELSTFYNRVVPQDFASARRLAYARLPEIARDADVRYQAATFDVDATVKNSRLGHLRINMVLQADYANFRRFIYALETAPEFIVVDDVTIAQGDPNQPLSVTLQLSTYYRLGANGT
jgi:hypothetical protein